MGMRAFPENVEFMVLAGECYIGCKDAEAALDTLMKCVKYARSKGGMGKEEKQNIQLLLAKAYLLKNEKDMAITVLQGILRENLDNDDALTEYAQLLFSLGPEQCEEAMTVILGVLARKQGDKRAKEVFAEMMRDAKGMEVLKKAAKSVFNDSAALVYLASCLRDHSVINSSLELFENALEISPNDPSIALIYIHTLEVIDNHIKILNFAQDFMKRYDSPGIGCMMHSCLNTIYDIIFSNILSGTGDKIELAKELDFETPTPEASYTYTDDDRYFLAFVFTVVKVLFVNGHLCGIPWLLKVMSSFYQGRDLHKSNIRNEAAYFNCIHEIMKTFSDHLPDLRAVPDDNVLYFVGDSHCIPAAWQTLNAQVFKTLLITFRMSL
ncbi:hypothetical protein DPMN_112259 [Dreissena polymorpha]|uniref:Uncharacterized protein n=1 Tax=Dreissena polymorpha TaxID=45954 RepID=A0A9D4QPU5_DREPO|nr:hypothetical protein DPMN_112259 [Dreissena polymorpha]